MKKIIAAIMAAAMTSAPVLADPKIEKWNTHHSMGCMLVQDCMEGVEKVTEFEQIQSLYEGADYSPYQVEITALLAELDRIGIDVYLADNKYFPRNHRGVYHTEYNRFYLNVAHMWDPEVTLKVMRHEAWHAAQDCMAGTFKNNFIAVILQDGAVPNGYTVRANVAYSMMPSSVPWEAEAMYAADVEGQTVNALRACDNEGVNMWDVFEPTPMTREWLTKNGYIK